MCQIKKKNCIDFSSQTKFGVLLVLLPTFLSFSYLVLSAIAILFPTCVYLEGECAYLCVEGMLLFLFFYCSNSHVLCYHFPSIYISLLSLIPQPNNSEFVSAFVFLGFYNLFYFSEMKSDVKQGEMERESDLSFAGSLPKQPQDLGLGHSVASHLGLSLGLSRGWQRSGTWTITHFSPSCLSQELDWG